MGKLDFRARLDVLGKSEILTERLDDAVRIKDESEESFSRVRCSVLMLRIFENEIFFFYIKNSGAHSFVTQWDARSFFKCYTLPEGFNRFSETFLYEIALSERFTLLC